MLSNKRDSSYVIGKEIIKLLGLNKSVLLQEIHYACGDTKDGWVCKSYREWEKYTSTFGWSHMTIKNMMDELIKDGILLSETREGKKSDYIKVNVKHRAFEGELEERKPKPGTLPRTDPDLVPYLSDPDPGIHIQDTTTDDDFQTLSKIYHIDDWQHKYAVSFWGLQHSLGNLTVPQWLKKAYVLQLWADEFDKIIRTKKGTKEDIIMIMRWLMEMDDFWLKNAVHSPKKFNATYKKEGCRFMFDFLMKKCRAAMPKKPQHKKTYRVTDVETMLKWYRDLKQSQFKKIEEGKFMFISEQG